MTFTSAKRVKAWMRSIARPLVVLDDRGQTYPVRTDIQREHRLNSARTLKTSSLRFSAGLFLAWFIGVPVLHFIGFMLAVPDKVVSMVVPPTFCICAFAVVLVQRRLNARAANKAGRRSIDQVVFIRNCLATGANCPACNYALDTPPEPDGCTVCAECGAAWKLGNWSAEELNYRFPAVNQSARTGPGRIPDGRGMEVPVLGRYHYGDRLQKLGRTIDVPSEIRFRLKRDKWVIASPVALGGLVLGWYGFKILTLGIVLACVGICVGLLLGSYRSHRKLLHYRSQTYAQLAVAQSLCPCCESPLRPTPSPIDACLLCDTCGCAWKPNATPPPAPNCDSVCSPSDLA